MLILLLVIVLALAFDVTNGFHDSSNSIATLVTTRAATPAAAVALAATCHVVGPFLLGTAVADTVGGIVNADETDVVPLVGAALSAAVAWNLMTWWRGLPSSSSHALVGGLTGAALADAGSSAVNWGGMDGIRPEGVLGVLFILALSPLVGAAAGFVVIGFARWATRRASRQIANPIRRAQWGTSAALALSHGGNDAQKTMGVVTLVLLAQGRIDQFVVPTWVKLAAAASMTLGTAFGGWRIVRTIGRGITRLRSIDGLASQSASASTIFGSAMIGAPVSTTHVVASSVVGVGLGRSWTHLRWKVVREMMTAWVFTLPACAAMGAALDILWRRFT
jgi:PiT family inorganic phosphate transporter